MAHYCFGRSALHYLCHWVDRRKLEDDDAGEIILEDVNEDWEDESTTIQTSSPVEWLIKTFTALGADVNGRDCCGYTPLHTAAITGSLVAAQAILRVPKVQFSLVDEKGFTPLDWASVNGHKSMAKALEIRGGTQSHGWQQNLRPLYQPWQPGFEDEPSDGRAGQSLAVGGC
ncbi:hypothetical protein DL766_008255 [Monosporascus sp. MC13-8B]|uniref:Uncharacterized protein n=1 Tax=Monosporascus cannonballus TaxID=155416 RepID=A0ABY0HB44_9PEZI|nr:hypothetical protein DL763_010886 [Monosporascus cannonballus]RYO89369.1 hypothetical protein DL762_003260 [Monosporascus cannonballus]RYP20158.1 hypothetical protein DL766_008255 [Monosporascus sp. MC13-8B]